MDNELLHELPPSLSPTSFYTPLGTFFQSGHDCHSSIVNGGSVLSTMQIVDFNNIYMANENNMACHSLSVSTNAPQFLNVGMHEYLQSTQHSASMTDFLHCATPLHDQFIEVNMKTSTSMDCCNNLESSLSTSSNYDFRLQDEVGFLASMKNSGEYSKFTDHQASLFKRFGTVGPPYNVTGSPNNAGNFDKSFGNFSHSQGCNAPSRERSLSLSTCEPSVTNINNIPDQCSEVGCSVTTQITSVDTAPLPEFRSTGPDFHNAFHEILSEFTPESRIHNSNEFPLYYSSATQPYFSSMLLGSKYLHVGHQILAELATYALADLSITDDSLGCIDPGTNMSISSSCSNVHEIQNSAYDKLTVVVSDIEHKDHFSSKRCQDTDRLRAELLTMLQLVDDNYNHCLDRVQNVISAFNQVTNSSNKNINLRFVLHSVSSLYKGLRERIASAIISVAKRSSSQCIEKMTSFDSSLAHKQWSLFQQSTKNDRHCWKPQRGLPDKSVSVLRQWMFQNFLHPYPNDNEKQFLAIKSGLSRSQVSNWFINARVRLWKPMIEEMYELSKNSNAHE